MASANFSAQLFYKDNNIVSHSIMDTQAGRFFLNIPVPQYQNFTIFLKLKGDDNTKKGTSEFSNETIVRKQFLEEVEKANELIKNLNSGMVYSRVNQLKELPVNELRDVLDENKPFDINKYRIIAQNIENLINENFRLMVSSNVKKESIEQTIMLISQNEPDKDFIEWLKNNLSSENNYKNVDELRKDYINSKPKLDISEFKEFKKDGETFIVGTNTKGQTFTVKIPTNYNMLMVFQAELKTIDPKILSGLNEKQVAKIIFEKITKDLPSQIMTEEPKKINENLDNRAEGNILERSVSNNQTNLIDPNNNIAFDPIEDKITTVEEENGVYTVDTPEVTTNNYNPDIGMPSEAQNQVQSVGKRRVLAPPKNRDLGFIKIGTIILFGLSFILTFISLVLIIAS